MTKSRKRVEEALKQYNATLISRDRYKKATLRSEFKKILMNIKPMNRAKARIGKYESYYEDVVANVEDAAAIEQRLQTEQLSRNEKAELKAEQAEYIEEARDYGHVMAKKVVKGLKNEGYYGRARVDAFLKNHPNIKRVYTSWLKARGKNPRKIKLNQSVLLRIISKLSSKARKDERFTRDVHKTYIEDMVENVADVRDGKMLHNPEAMGMLAPENIRETLKNVADVEYGNRIPNLKPVKFENGGTPQTTPSTPVDPTAPTQSAKDFVSAMGKKAMEEENLKTQVSELKEQVRVLSEQLGAAKTEIKRLSDENESLRTMAYSPVTPVPTATDVPGYVKK